MSKLTKNLTAWCRLFCCLSLAVLLTTAPFKAEAKELVLLDTDMVELFDDGAAMLLLAESPDVELLGVTVVTGNSWAEDGAAYAIKQLETIGKADVPVVIGKTSGELVERFGKIEEESHLFGRGHDSHNGAAMFQRPESWESAYLAHYGEEPQNAPLSESAADFIIRTVKAHPGEVTIVAIGPCTNIAAAIAKDPEIVPMAKRIAYMSGSFFQQGNVTPAAEFNVWTDPAAAKQVMRAPWAEQIIVPLDACEKMAMTSENYQNYRDITKNPVFSMMLERHYLSQRLASGNGPTFIWDVLTAALILDESIIQEEVTLPIDVNDVWSPSYGQTLAYLGVAPDGTQKARIVKTVDQQKILSMLDELFRSL